MGSSKAKQADQDQNTSALRQAELRAEEAEKEAASLRKKVESLEAGRNAPSGEHPRQSGPGDPVTGAGGVDALRRDTMMAYLLDSLDAGKDIGHYGRLVFAMVARHFLSEEDLVSWLRKDRDFTAEAAAVLMRQVEGRDYNPPRRERILEWQREQEFPIVPQSEDPDCGNVYRSLKFPDHVYQHIEEYQEEKAAS